MNYCFDPALYQRIRQVLLPDVQLPGQYIGGEPGQTVKPAESVHTRLCFAFPDTYTIGMSNYALQLLYSIVNRNEDLCCERVFCPRPDMEKVLRDEKLPLYSLETFTPLYCFDVLGFTFQYEMSYTNVLTMLRRGWIPLDRRTRTAADPLIIAGGPAVYNPEPMANFIDVFVPGDGEESLPALCRFWSQLKDAAQVRRRLCSGDAEPLDNGEPDISDSLRREMLLEIARRFPGVYVPEFYKVTYGPDGVAGRPRPVCDGVPEYIRPAMIRNLDAFPPSTDPLVPLVESVQDRISLEIMRGCPQKCRFCQSSPIKRPLRFRSVDQIVSLARESTEKTGVRDVTLLSLSSSEYPWFDGLMEKLRETVCPMGVSLAVPSLRVNHQLSDVMKSLTNERSSSITMAPEAARDEMRRRIAKKVTNDDLMAGCRAAFENGFYRIKMYFMCGFPNETEEDVEGIVRLCEEVAYLGKQVRGRFPTIVANVSNFVPKPQTPLQWEGMASADYLRNAHILLKKSRRLKSVEVKYHELKTSLLEGLLARGDRRVGDVILAAWENGARLDSWNDFFQYEHWTNAIERTGINVQKIVHTPYSVNDELPWEHITTYVPREKLLKEYEASKQ